MFFLILILEFVHFKPNILILKQQKHSEIDFLSISNNTADEQKNWCATEGVDMTILADDGNFWKGLWSYFKWWSS